MERVKEVLKHSESYESTQKSFCILCGREIGPNISPCIADFNDCYFSDDPIDNEFPHIKPAEECSGKCEKSIHYHYHYNMNKCGYCKHWEDKEQKAFHKSNNPNTLTKLYNDTLETIEQNENTIRDSKNGKCEYGDLISEDGLLVSFEDPFIGDGPDLTGDENETERTQKWEEFKQRQNDELKRLENENQSLGDNPPMEDLTGELSILHRKPLGPPIKTSSINNAGKYAAPRHREKGFFNLVGRFYQSPMNKPILRPKRSPPLPWPLNIWPSIPQSESKQFIKAMGRKDQINEPFIIDNFSSLKLLQFSSPTGGKGKYPNLKAGNTDFKNVNIENITRKEALKQKIPKKSKTKYWNGYMLPDGKWHYISHWEAFQSPKEHLNLKENHFPEVNIHENINWILPMMNEKESNELLDRVIWKAHKRIITPYYSEKRTPIPWQPGDFGTHPRYTPILCLDDKEYENNLPENEKKYLEEKRSRVSIVITEEHENMSLSKRELKELIKNEKQRRVGLGEQMKDVNGLKNHFWPYKEHVLKLWKKLGNGKIKKVKDRVPGYKKNTTTTTKRKLNQEERIWRAEYLRFCEESLPSDEDYKIIIEPAKYSVDVFDPDYRVIHRHCQRKERFFTGLRVVKTGKENVIKYQILWEYSKNLKLVWYPINKRFKRWMKNNRAF